MNKQQKTCLSILIPAAAVWLILLAAATGYDLELSLAIADTGSIFGRTLEIAAEPPAILFTSFNFSLMCAYFIKRPDRMTRDIVFAVLTFIGSVGTAVYTCRKTLDYITDWMQTEASLPAKLLAAAFSCAIAGLFFWNVLRMRFDALVRYFGAARHCALAAVLTFVIIWAFKLTWGRVRFRQLDGDLSRFTAWYLPQGFTGFFSFPSGHTANAAVVFTTTYYFEFLPKKYEKFKPLFMALLVLWIIAAAFSRVRVGAHYLSDVLFGAAITFLIVFFCSPKKENHDSHR